MLATPVCKFFIKSNEFNAIFRVSGVNFVFSINELMEPDPLENVDAILEDSAANITNLVRFSTGNLVTITVTGNEFSPVSF